MTNIYLKSGGCLPEVLQMSFWCLSDACLMPAWQLLDTPTWVSANCMTTAWQQLLTLPNNQLICQTHEEDFFQILYVSQKVRTLNESPTLMCCDSSTGRIGKLVAWRKSKWLPMLPWTFRPWIDNWIWSVLIAPCTYYVVALTLRHT